MIDEEKILLYAEIINMEFLPLLISLFSSWLIRSFVAISIVPNYCQPIAKTPASSIIFFSS